MSSDEPRYALECEHRQRGMSIRRYRFENGLGLIALAAHGAPIVSYQTWFRVGSRHERRGATGMAHLFEHLMFNRTSNLAPGEFDRLIDRTGGDSNAATWVDWTSYRCSVPSRELELAIRLEADRMQNLVLEAEPLETERDVVIHERLLRVEDEVDGFLEEELFKLAFAQHPYHWPTIGWMEDIRALSLDEVRRFYRAHYGPNNATLVVVGDFDEPVLLQLVTHYYGRLPRAEVLAEQVVSEPEQDTERRAQFEKPISAPRLLWGYRAPGQGDPDWTALSFLGALLSSGPSSRLYRKLVVERELASSVQCGAYPFRDPSLFRVAVVLLADADPRELEAVLEEEFARLADNPVEAVELAKVASGVETDFWTELETCDGKGEALGHFETALGDFRRLFAQAERLRQVSADDLLRVAGRYLRPERRTALFAGGAAAPAAAARSRT
jgi:zinc protease